jgi:endonuclease YncB( thermonuclease family)
MFCNTSFADSLRVVDGDTIVLNGEKIRFTGIDTPELKQTCLKDDQEVACGMTAKMLLVKKIGNNTPECISEVLMSSLPNTGYSLIIVLRKL